MNINKIKLELNHSELKALFTMLNSCRQPDEDVPGYIMEIFIMGKVVKKIMNRLVNPPKPGKTTHLSLHKAEGIALVLLLNNVDTALTYDIYNKNLIMKINNIVKQKLV